jgi:hypothetical protein
MSALIVFGILAIVAGACLVRWADNMKAKTEVTIPPTWTPLWIEDVVEESALAFCHCDDDAFVEALKNMRIFLAAEIAEAIPTAAPDEAETLIRSTMERTAIRRHEITIGAGTPSGCIH